jgi:hypothetical protein
MFAVSPHLWMVKRDASPSIVLRTASLSRLRACWTVWQQHTWLLPTDGRLCLDKLSGQDSATSGAMIITPIIAIDTFEGSVSSKHQCSLEAYRIASGSAELAFLRFALPRIKRPRIVRLRFLLSKNYVLQGNSDDAGLLANTLAKLSRCQLSDAASEQPLAPKPKSDVFYNDLTNIFLPSLPTMASRNRPRGAFVKEDASDAHEERNMWSQIVTDIKRLRATHARAAEVAKAQIELEAKMGKCKNGVPHCTSIY